MKCPICNNECDTRIIDTQDGYPVEVESECGGCMYYHFNTYGYSTTTIDGVSVYKSPHDSKEVSEMKEKITELAIQISKEEIRWRKYI